MPVKSYLVLLLLPVSLAAEGAADMTKAMAVLKREVETAVCPKGTPACALHFETVTQNEVAPDEYIWAFSYELKNTGTEKQADLDNLAKSLAGLKAAVLDLSKTRITAISYFREANGSARKVSPEDFHKWALNPWSNVVARHDADFLAKGNRLGFAIPEIWKKEGIAPATTSGIILTGQNFSGAETHVELVTLDDKPIHGISITNRKLAASAAKPDKFQLNLQIQAGRNIKTDQPAFKIVVKYPKGGPPVAQIAIPLKPRPNYFLFAVVGFLFGGLIAVMLLIMRRHKPANGRYSSAGGRNAPEKI